MSQIWLIVGASRGIGFEFVTQLLACGHIVIATARSSPVSPSGPENTSGLGSLANGPNAQNLAILECDVSKEESIKGFVEEVRKLGRRKAKLEGGIIDVVVLNAGVLEYPNRISETSFGNFQHHISTNAIGPLITASSLLSLSTPSQTPSITPVKVKTLVFISSDSGSAARFRAHEDGFGAYSVSKAALNQGLRHLAAEIGRKTQAEGKVATAVLAIHPGEVATDMASGVTLDWEVEGVITPKESVQCMLKVIAEKGSGGVDEAGKVSMASEERGGDVEATFWDWEGRKYPW